MISIIHVVADFIRKFVLTVEMTDNSTTVSTGYDPCIYEPIWAEHWEKSGLYQVSNEDLAAASSNDRFVMVIPPPNVTGSLHLGHTMMVAVQDCLTRYNRMLGKKAVWIPGLDHAGIATQSVVERELLRSENKSRHDIGREEFVARTMDWKTKYGNRILYQLRRLGASCDWSREVFTMDQPLSEAVTEAFVRLHEKGLVFRESRLVSWCPHLRTALSDIEVDVDEIEKPTRLKIPGFDSTVEVGILWKFRYPLAKPTNSGINSIEVATTRIETMLGDVAVAVHPNDARYKDLIGCDLIHPFIPDRKIIIVADEYCDPEYGTGAVKITPAHDKNDYEIAKRHNLQPINIFSLDGKIDLPGSQFHGLHRFKARVGVEKELEKIGLMGEKIPNPHKMSLPRCSRSNDIVEYMLLPQWWVHCESMAEKAMQAAKNKELDLLPEGTDRTWYYWLNNVKDWCVSRQLWWGHRIPAYQIIMDDQTYPNMEWVVARTREDAEEKANSMSGGRKFELEQDPDVLDTWFSSALFPFSSLGWPHRDISHGFPTTLLETGGDILFFWVARMVMMSLELLGVLPFKTVYLHPIVRDSQGKKMSKSLGNVIDPVNIIEGCSLETLADTIKSSNLKKDEIARALELQAKAFPKGIEPCGADAVRIGLLAYMRGTNRSVNMEINRVVGYKHFCNKLWNATKFAITYFNDAEQPRVVEGHRATDGEVCNTRDYNYHPTIWADRWILHRSSEVAKNVNDAFKQFEFGAAVESIYSFWISDFCDIYLELLKPRLNNNSDSKSREHGLHTMFIVMDRGLRLLHPLTPYITEELWARLLKVSPKFEQPPSIGLASFPHLVEDWHDTHLEEEMFLFLGIVRKFRSMLAQFEVPPKIKLDGFVQIKTTTQRAFIEQRCEEIATLAKLQSVSSPFTQILILLSAPSRKPTSRKVDHRNWSTISSTTQSPFF